MRHDALRGGRLAVRLLIILVLVLLPLGARRAAPAFAGPVASATLAVSSATALADGVTAISLVAVTHDVLGAAAPGVTLRFATDHPDTAITQPLTTTDTLGRAFGAITSMAAGLAVITVLDTASGASLASARITFLPAPDPALSSLRAGPPIAGPSLVSTIPLTLTVHDYQGGPLPLRAMRLSSANPGDTIVQPLLTNSQGQAMGSVAFTSTVAVVTATDLTTGVILGTISLRGVPPPVTTGGIHAVLRPAATRMGNGDSRAMEQDGARVSVRLTLLDGQNRPLAGKRVALGVTAFFAQAGPPAVTDAAGSATMWVGVRRLERHYGTAAGPVAISALDLSDDVPLTATTQITVYNRVAVLLSGLGTSLSCTLTSCHDRQFGQISADALAPLGYNLNGDGLRRTELEYSYRGGSMAPLKNGTWQWLVTPYKACDTAQPLGESVQALRDLLQSYRDRYPYTTFELIAHSLGGLVALDALADDGGAFLRRLGPAAVDKVITIDSPVNGISRGDAFTLVADLFGGIALARHCTAQLFGVHLIDDLAHLGNGSPGLQDHWIAALAAQGVHVLTATNADDEVVPESDALIDYGRPRASADRLRYALGTGYQEGHGALLFRARPDGTPSPAWPSFISILQGYLTDSCAAFAPPGAACPYPTISRGL